MVWGPLGKKLSAWRLKQDSQTVPPPIKPTILEKPQEIEAPRPLSAKRHTSLEMVWPFFAAQAIL